MAILICAIELREEGGEKMMRRLRFCCEGADIVVEAEPKEKTIVHEKTEACHKAKDTATVIPAKRKGVKNMVCNCIITCICGKCLETNNTKTKIVSPPPASNFNRRRNPVCSPPQSIYGYGAANYGNKTKGI